MKTRFWLVGLIIWFAGCGQPEHPQTQSQSTTTATSSQSGSSVMPNPHMLPVETGEMTWKAPEGWVEEMPSSSMRKGQFRLPKVAGDSEDGEVAIFHFPGQGGSVEANLQRWYGQFSQPDGRSTAEVAERTVQQVNGLQQTLVTFNGTYLFKANLMSPDPPVEKPGYRMLAGVVETDAGPWFVKATGPEATMKHWEESFHEFMKTFKLTTL